MSARAVRMNRAIAERRRQVMAGHARHRRSIALGLVATASAGAGIFWLLTGPAVAIRSLEIHGYHRPDAPVVARYAQDAVSRGTMLRLPEGEVRAELRRFPWVHDFVITRRWPSGVTIDIAQARPAAIAVDGGGATRVLLSQDGRVLGLPSSARDAADLPTVTVNALPRKIGEVLATPEERAAVRIATDFEPSGGDRIDQLAVHGGGIFGRMDTGLEVRFGPAERVGQKLAALDQVLPRLSADEVGPTRYVDVRAPEYPAAGTVAQEASTTGSGLGSVGAGSVTQPSTSN